jgi:hypothetical protein
MVSVRHSPSLSTVSLHLPCLANGSLILLIYRYCRYTGKDPTQAMQTISHRTLKAFFDWLLNQRRGKGGRRLKGVKSSDSLGTYWKVFRLVHERATGSKIDGKLNRKMHRVS